MAPSVTVRGSGERQTKKSSRGGAENAEGRKAAQPGDAPRLSMPHHRVPSVLQKQAALVTGWARHGQLVSSPPRNVAVGRVSDVPGNKPSVFPVSSVVPLETLFTI